MGRPTVDVPVAPRKATPHAQVVTPIRTSRAVLVTAHPVGQVAVVVVQVDAAVAVSSVVPAEVLTALPAAVEVLSLVVVGVPPLVT